MSHTSPCEKCITRSICSSASSNFQNYHAFYVYLTRKCELFKNFVFDMDENWMYNFQRLLSSEEIINRTFPKVRYER